MLKGEKSGTKNYKNGSFCNCSKLLQAQCKKKSAQIIDAQVCSITSEEKLKVFFHAKNCYKEFRYFLENSSFHRRPKSQACVKQC